MESWRPSRFRGEPLTFVGSAVLGAIGVVSVLEYGLLGVPLLFAEGYVMGRLAGGTWPVAMLGIVGPWVVLFTIAGNDPVHVAVLVGVIGGMFFLPGYFFGDAARPHPGRLGSPAPSSRTSWPGVRTGDPWSAAQMASPSPLGEGDPEVAARTQSTARAGLILMTDLLILIGLAWALSQVRL